MKKTFITLAIVLVALTAQAQFKIHDDGQISIGSLTKSFGVQVRSNGFTTFCPRYNTPGSWATLSYSRHDYQKHWIVANLADETDPGKHTFFVNGNGRIYSRGHWIDVPVNNNLETTSVGNAGDVLDSISGIWYYPIGEDERAREERTRRVGVKVQEVEKALPEAVSTDESGVSYVSYEALTVFLIEAVKEQRQEILLLRKTLEVNGLMEPEKP